MKTTEQKNRMIAEFMYVIKYRPYGDYVEINGDAYEVEDLNYHTSWDWLMPVLKKISGVLFSEFAYSVTEQWRMIESPTKYDIKNVHEQAYQFIEWYNENK